jgi:integrase/recombinase XerC
MSNTFQTYQSAFLDYLRFQKRYSNNTTIAYENDLSAFATYLRINYEITDVTAVKTTYIRSWLAEIKEDEMTSRSINRKISSLRSFFKYLLKQEVVVVNPATTITSPKVPKKLPQFVEEKDTDTLLNEIEFEPNFKGQTEKLILQILYNTGIRKAELINLKEHNIDKANRQIKVLGKGNKERIIPLSQELIHTIFDYIDEKRKLHGRLEHGLLCVSVAGKALDPKAVYNIVKKHLTGVTTIDKRSPHILRHTFATQLMNKGADLNAVKELLGHASLAATQVYTHNTIEKLKDVYKKAHPKA